MNYYYFAASLPTVLPDQPPPLRPTDFLALCRQHLRPGDFAAVRLVLEGIADPAYPPPAFAARWHIRETRLRRALARLRAARLGRDAAAYRFPDDAGDSAVDKAVAEAYALPDPESRERALDRFRWTQAGELAGFNPFSLESILAYAVRLQLAARWAVIDADAGRAVLDNLVNQPVAA